MKDPIKIIHKFKNVNKRIQYKIFIFVGSLVPDDILKILDNPKLFPKNQYKIPLDEFEKKTKTSFKTLKREIDDLFRSQIMSGQVEQDIWFFIPTHLR